MMNGCTVIRSTKVELDPDMRWNIKLDFNGVKPFENIELEDKIISEVEISRCENYGDYDDVVVVVFALKDKHQK